MRLMYFAYGIDRGRAGEGDVVYVRHPTKINQPFPCLLEQDVTSEVAQTYPALYRDGVEHTHLTTLIFWR